MYTHQKQSIMLIILFKLSPFLLQKVCEVKVFNFILSMKKIKVSRS